MIEEFKEYESKPIKRKALQMVDGRLEHFDGATYRYWFQTPEGPAVIMFAAHQKPMLGDWIVYLNDHDVYHCTDQVFRERNIVPA